jgi:hypothetical protein
VTPIVEQVGSGVTSLTQGDRVVMPFNVACGFCKNCVDGYTGYCLTVNPGFAGGAYGYVAMGPYKGGQAEYLRVPYADFNCLKLPAGTEHEADFVLLADIFPTGYHGCELAEVSPGESVAVYGGGPVGLMAAYSALLRGRHRPQHRPNRIPEFNTQLSAIRAAVERAVAHLETWRILSEEGGRYRPPIRKYKSMIRASSGLIFFTTYE